MTKGPSPIFWAFIAMSLIAGCGCSTATRSTNTSHDVWWESSEVTADAIVGYLAFRHQERVVAANAEFYAKIMSLVLLFDEWDSEKSMETLADLGSYYLGAHGGELLSCIIVRKGSLAQATLDAVRRSDRNDCAQRFGRSSPICVDEQAYRSALDELVDRIEAGERCTVDR